MPEQTSMALAPLQAPPSEKKRYKVFTVMIAVDYDVDLSTIHAQANRWFEQPHPPGKMLEVVDWQFWVPPGKAVVVELNHSPATGDIFDALEENEELEHFDGLYEDTYDYSEDLRP